MSETLITVYVGDTTDYLATVAKLSDSTAKLITSSNYKQLVPGTYYVSIGDLNTLVELGAVFRQADVIIYAAPTKWSHQKLKLWTEDYLTVFADKVQGFEFPYAQDKDTILNLVTSRQGDQPQLWVAGCSISYGLGIDDQQRYGQLLANTLSLPVSFLARTGASIAWAADQILRSDIRPGDTVVWGLTSVERFTYFKNNQLAHVNIGYYEANPKFRYQVDISFLDSQQLIYQAVTEIHKVINFCEKLGVKLILAQLFGRGLEKYMHGNFYYIMLADQFGRDPNNNDWDKGTDNRHPGVNMHQWYHDQIIKRFYE